MGGKKKKGGDKENKEKMCQTWEQNPSEDKFLSTNLFKKYISINA